MKSDCLTTLIVTLFLATSPSSLLAADATEDSKAKAAQGQLPNADSELLQGTWEGVEVGREAEGKCTMTVTGDSLHFQGSNKGEWYKATFKLPAGTNPKQLNAKISECPAPDFIGKSAFSIYKLEEGKLTLVGHKPGTPDAPKQFEGDSESRTFVFKKTQR